MPELKELLGDDLYNQVAEKAGDNKLAVVSDGNWFPKEKFDQLNSEYKDLKGQLKERDTQLEELKPKAAGNEALLQQIDQLTQKNKETAESWEQKLNEQTYNFTLKEALASAKVRNPKAVEGLLDKEQIKLDGDKLTGLDEQLKGIRESDPYLFEEEKKEEEKPFFMQANHQRQEGDAPTSLADALAQKFSK